MFEVILFMFVLVLGDIKHQLYAYRDTNFPEIIFHGYIIHILKHNQEDTPEVHKSNFNTTNNRR